MQPLIVLVVLFTSAVFGFSPVKQQYETTTINELDNSVFPTESSTNLPHPEHVPTTGCFSNIPNAQNVDQTNNMVPSTPVPQPLSDPVPPQYTPYPHQRPFNRPVVPGFNPNYTPGFYPNRPVMPFVQPMPFMPYQRFPFAPQQMNGRNFVIVKLLQPIILPVAKPFSRRGDDNEIDNGRYMNGGFQRRNDFNRFNGNRNFGGFNNEVELNRLVNNMPQRRFVMNQFTNRRFGVGNEVETGRFVNGQFQPFGGNRRFGPGNFNRPMPYRQNTFGPYKVGSGDENIQVTVNLH